MCFGKSWPTWLGIRANMALKVPANVAWKAGSIWSENLGQYDLENPGQSSLKIRATHVWKSRPI